MRLLFTPSGRTQFLDVIRFLAGESPKAARTFRKNAERSLQRLQQYPESGRILPEFPDLPFREVIMAPYRFFYRVPGKTVWIVAVRDGAQLPETPSGKD
jgi:toxin ParE1/3/4